MTIKLGNTTINKIYLGSTEIKKVYLGSTLIYNKTATLWTPASEASQTFALWFDANDTGTITKDGSNYVSQWDDKSGNDRHLTQSIGSSQPTYSENDQWIDFNDTGAYLRFDGLTAEEIAGATRKTFMTIGVCNYDEDGIHWWWGSATNRYGVENKDRFNFTNAGSGKHIINPAFTQGNQFIFSFSASDNYKRARLNLSSSGSFSYSGALSAETANFYMGSLAGSYGSGIKMQEFIHCNFYDSEMETKIETYLNNKWGVV